MAHRTEAYKIAEDYGVSMTPVRESLNRLTGEGLVVMRYGEGFRVPRFTENALCDMLGLHRLLVTGACPCEGAPDCELPESGGEQDYAQAVLETFVGLAQASENSAIVFVVRALGERLQPIRMLEPTVLDGTDDELRDLSHSRVLGWHQLMTSIAAYHDRRVDKAAALIAALP